MAEVQGESTPETRPKKPICLITLGMAGSGKTSFVKRLTTNLIADRKPAYVINLDPACYEVPYTCNIDIRDTVKYKEVMKQFNLGPNGGIITSLNLFATKFDQIMNLLQKRENDYEYIIIDTPGQIEVFTWSASGTIITDTLATAYPTIVVYIIDVVRSESPVTFMSNMLYACSILYKTKLPFIIVFNKTDLKDCKFAVDWMTDFEKFDFALDQQGNYVSNLTRSMSLMLDDFYKELKTVGVSSVENQGIDEFFTEIKKLEKEYYDIYLPEYERIKKEAEEQKEKELNQPKQDEIKTPKVSTSKRPNLIEFGDFATIQEEEEGMSQSESEDETEKQEYKQFVQEFASKLKSDN